MGLFDTFIWGSLAGNILALCGFVYAWPHIRHKRSYIVAAAVLCLGPAPIGSVYITLNLPLIISLPIHLAFLPSSILQITYFILPSCIPLGIMAWYAASRYLNEERRRGLVVLTIVGLLVAWGLLIGKSKFAMDLAAWSLPMSVVYTTWPWLRARRLYIVIAAVLCLTTGSAGQNFWPLILTIPDNIIKGSLDYQHIMMTGGPIGVMAWIFASRLFREEKAQPDPPEASGKIKSKRAVPAAFIILMVIIVCAAILLDRSIGHRVSSTITVAAIEQSYGEKFDEVVALMNITDSDERERRAQELKQFFQDDEAVLEVYLKFRLRDEKGFAHVKSFFHFDRYEWGRNTSCGSSEERGIYRCDWKGSRLIGESEEKCIQPSGRHICPWDRDEVNRNDIIMYNARHPNPGEALTYEDNFKFRGMTLEVNFAQDQLTTHLRTQKRAGR